MQTKVTRRDILKLAGGSVLGMMFTPVPWKLLDDSSIWTQNWSLIPPVPRGPITFKYSACTLCPAGCAVKARLVSEIPVSITGVANHPLTHGAMCPLGFAGHTMPYHPLRISQPQRFSSRSADAVLQPISFDDATSAITSAIKSNEGAIAILDRNPGRIISQKYKELESSNVHYLTSAASENLTLATLSEMMPAEQKHFEFDFANAKRVISFGAPLLDGWGTPGQMNSIFAKRSESGLKLIQVESRESRTALQADRWLPIKVDTEGILALGIANVLLNENLVSKTAADRIEDFGSYKNIVSRFNPETVAALTGIRKELIVETARGLAKSGPSIVVAGTDPGAGPLNRQSRIAVAGLNILLSSIGQVGGIVAGDEVTTPKHIEDMPDHSIKLLVIDDAESGYALPWSLVERKLVNGKSLVVSLSPFVSGMSAHADIIMPAPAPYETIREANTRATTFAPSAPLFPKSEGSVEPYDIARKIAAVFSRSGFDDASYEDLLRKHVRSIHESKKGTVFSPQDASTTAVSAIASAEELWTKLLEGGTWIGERTSGKVDGKFNLTGKADELHALEPKPVLEQHEYAVLPFGWRGAVSSSVAPVMSKLFQESDLRSNAGRASINPHTASANGISFGDTVRISTGSSSMEVPVTIDPSVQPNIIEVAVGPLANGSAIADQLSSDGVLALSSVNNDGTWRFTKVSLTKV